MRLFFKMSTYKGNMAIYTKIIERLEFERRRTNIKVIALTSYNRLVKSRNEENQLGAVVRSKAD